MPTHFSIPSTSPSAIANTSVSVSAQRGLLDPVQQPANAQFQYAEGVNVNGGGFTNASGDVLNNVDVGVTLNLTKRMPGFKMCRLPRTYT